MTDETYDKGDSVRIFAIFRDKTQAAIDAVGLAEKAATGVDPGKLRNPSTMVLKTRDPAGVNAVRTPAFADPWTHPPTKYVATETAMTGEGYAQFILPLTSADAQHGDWEFWWQGTGVVPVVAEGSFRVRRTNF